MQNLIFKTKDKKYNLPEFGYFKDYVQLNNSGIRYFTHYFFHAANKLNKEFQFMSNLPKEKWHKHEVEKHEKLDKQVENLARESIDHEEQAKFHKNTSHELNTLFNKLYQDCVYTNQNGKVGVIVPYFEYEGKKYKVGDTFNVDGFDLDKEEKFKSIGTHFLVVKYSILEGFYFDRDNRGIKYKISEHHHLTRKEKIVNPLDEYFTGKNELAKLCGFN